MRQLILIMILFSLASCHEQNELIDLVPRDAIQLYKDSVSGNVEMQPKHVLLEEITGVRCINCPNAQLLAAGIEASNSGRVHLLSIHTGIIGNLGDPYPESTHDFRTADGAKLVQTFGTPQSLPVGDIDRAHFNGNVNILRSSSEWGSLVADRLALSPQLTLTFPQITYDSISNELTARVRVGAQIEVRDPLYLSVFLIESNIIDLQAKGVAIDSQYIHNHVLRKVIESYNGHALGEGWTKGRVREYIFKTRLDRKWQPHNMNIMVLVHRRNAEGLEVLQSNEAKLR